MTKAAELAKMGEVLTNSQIGGRRNLIINGAMQVAQRGTSATSTGNAHYNFIVENQNNRTRTTTALRTWILNADYGSTGAVDAIDYSMTFMGDLA